MSFKCPQIFIKHPSLSSMYNVIRHLMNLSQSTDRRTHFCTSERVKNNKNFEVTFVLGLIVSVLSSAA